MIVRDGLTKRYAGGVTALDGLTACVEPGIAGLVGANGAGKTTLIRILLGLLRPTQGSARVLGLDPARDGSRVRTLVGYMPEHECLPRDLSATDFVTHMAQMSGLQMITAGLLGMLFAGLRLRIMLSLWPMILAHAAFDVPALLEGYPAHVPPVAFSAALFQVGLMLPFTMLGLGLLLWDQLTGRRFWAVARVA